MLPWPVGLLHGNGKPSWSCHSHLGAKSNIIRQFWTAFHIICLLAKPKSLLQGSVVVFSSWPNWTSEDVTSPDYCMETPMLFAFVLQIVRWVSATLIFKVSDGRNYFQGFDRDLHHPWLFCLLLGMLQGAIWTHICNHGLTLMSWMNFLSSPSNLILSYQNPCWIWSADGVELKCYF